MRVAKGIEHAALVNIEEVDPLQFVVYSERVVRSACRTLTFYPSRGDPFEFGATH
jgi:hypothetical protein